MGIERTYVCDVCGEECLEEDLVDGTTYILAVRVPPSEDVQQMFACCPECWVAILQRLIEQVDVEQAGENPVARVKVPSSAN